MERLTAGADSITLHGSTTWQRTADLTFTGRLDESWNGLNGGPLGGYTFAAALRALAHVLPSPDPLVASAYFLRRAAVGDAVASVDVIRRGRSVSTGQASILQDDREVLRVLATFGDLAAANGLTVVSAEPPELPPPDACIDPLADMSFSGITILDRVEYRYSAAPGWLSGTPTGASEQTFWMRLRTGERPDAYALALLVDAAAPGVMELGAAGSSTLELTVQFRGVPSTDWLLCRCSTRVLVDGYHEEDFEIWDATGRLVALSRQLAAAA
jgi:acyl-CoA thioesterase